MPAIATESHYELAAIDRLKSLGYRHLYGGEIDRPLTAVILEAPLREQGDRRAFARRDARQRPPARSDPLRQRPAAGRLRAGL